MARKLGSHSETTGPRVRSAALELIARHGFAAVSMRQIAQQVGVQAGALYRYTPDKQTLLFDLLHTHMNELMEAVSQVDLDLSPLAALEAFTLFHIRFHLDRPDEVFLSYMELRNLDSENFAVIEQQRKDYETLLESILRRGQDSGVFRIEDTKVATLALIAMLTGLTSWYRDDGRLGRGEIEQLYWHMVRNSVGVTDMNAQINAAAG